MEYTKRRNINRGYMKLEVWQNAINLLQIINQIISNIDTIDFKIKSQLIDAVQSISSNIAEGYCRKSINEYLYYLNVSLGSSGETLTRIIGLKVMNKINDNEFESIDGLHYLTENQLLSLIKSLQLKRKDGSWDDEIQHERFVDYTSDNP